MSDLLKISLLQPGTQSRNDFLISVWPENQTSNVEIKIKLFKYSLGILARATQHGGCEVIKMRR